MRKGYEMGMDHVYDTVEFDNWANKERLHDTEHYLVRRYLDQDAKTLEGGTGGGRILLALHDLGFESLHGFDFSARLIGMARGRDASHRISFDIQNAVELDYADESFDQIIYLEQLISVIQGSDEREKAVCEAARILSPAGTALFSFVCIEARHTDWKYMPFLAYISLLRKLTASRKTLQSLPWLKLGGTFNVKALIDRGPYAYWFSLEEAGDLLRRGGFHVVAAGSNLQIQEGRMCDSLQALRRERVEGQLFVVCTK